MKVSGNRLTATIAGSSALLLAACGGMFGEGDTTATTGTGTTAGAQQSGAAQTQLSAQDRDFVMRAAQSGMAEVEASRAAATRAANGKVRDFAQQMVRDHTASNEELMRIAQSKGIQLGTELDPEHRQRVEALMALQGDEFDRAYMQDMGVRAHEEAVQLFERQAREGQDPDLRAFAGRMLGALRQHLAMAEQLETVAATQ